MIKAEITLPLLNANEPEARLADIHIKNGQLVKQGTLLFTIETTKMAAEIVSPDDGYIHIVAGVGDLLTVGQKIALLNDMPEADPDNERIEDKRSTPVGLRITRPAKELAEDLGLDLSTLPTDHLVTESIIRQYITVDNQPEIQIPAGEKPYLLIYGAGGHAKSVLEIFLHDQRYSIAGIIDDDSKIIGHEVQGVKVLGGKNLLPVLLSQGVRLAVNCVGGILDLGIRAQIFERLDGGGFSLPLVVHSHAVVESSASIGEGSQVFANAYVGADVRIEPWTIINTSAVISHDCWIGKCTHIAPGVLLAGNVRVGDRTLIGMGVTTAIGIKIGGGARIGNGAVILADVPDRMIVQSGRTWDGNPSHH